MHAAQLTDDQLVELAEMFKLWRSQPPENHCGMPERADKCPDIASQNGLSQPLVSHHLRLLRAARVAL
jgi:DNA-binding transcriptional ArsR family regulator